ncbi:MAG: stress response translation initiation inhibitor YciH [Candidatus Parvarchaeota archaeon]|nr:stress response translation initiation inhibitor YciH [Candidatus Parvarchaeota archaeon]MCW1301546.1 stress response translation initiation inhibitor YciH [Candidatus Parvarchaeota archaeon]
MEICPVCGLPKDMCVCGSISQTSQKIKIFTKKVSFKKTMTIISGFDPKLHDIKELTKKLKTEIACGGTYKDNHIELQGDHTDKVRQILIKNGFDENSISS